MKAEQEAENLVSRAKKDRQHRLRQAKDKAEEELKVFREDQEHKFQAEVGAKATADPSADLSGETAAEARAVQKDYTNNKEATIKFIVEKVLDVKTGLTETQK